MDVRGNIVFQDNGGQLVNAILYNLDTHPVVPTEGKIYWNTSERKAYIYSGTQWIEISTPSNINYTAGIGIDITTAQTINIDLADQSGLEFSNENKIKLKVDLSELTLDGDGLSIKLGGIIDEHIATGTISDSKLLQITTTNKVAGSAVEDVFLRNDGNDTSSGSLTLGGTLEAPNAILQPTSTPPTSTQGRIFFDDTVDKLKYYDGTAWQTLLDTVGAGVSSVNGSSPITVNGNSGTGEIGAVVLDINEATTSTDGYISSTDWNTFNGKQDVVSSGDGIAIATNTISVDIKADSGLDFDSGELYVKLKSGGEIAVDADGLYFTGQYATFQRIYDATVVDQATSDATFKVDNSGSLSIENNAEDVTVLQVRDGDVDTSLVTMSNTNVVGDLTVQGSETRLVTDEINCKPLELVMAVEQSGTPLSTDDGKFTINRGSEIDASMVWDESEGKWGFDNGTGVIVYPPSKYATTFSVVGSPNTLSILASAHGLGASDEILVQVLDDSSPRKMIYPSEVEIDTNGDVTITFDSSQDGKIVLMS